MNTETTNVEQADKSQDCPIAIIKRRDGQTYEEFKKEQNETNKMIRYFIKGTLFHDSSTGTYDVGMRKIKNERRAIKKMKIKFRKLGIPIPSDL